MKFEEYVLARDSEMGLFNFKESLFSSPSLFKEMAILNPNSLSKIQKALEFVNQNNIKVVLMGGMAVSHFATDRALTPDIDFLAVDMFGLKHALTRLNLGFKPLMFYDAKSEGIQVPQLDADFMDAQKGNVPFNKYIIQTATTARIGGLSVPVINPIVLLIHKFDLGRAKDVEDAFKILPTVPLDALKTHLKAVQNMLHGDINAKTIWGYAKAMVGTPS